MNGKRLHGEAGVSMLEILVAMTIGLLVAIAAYGFIDWGIKTQAKQSDQAESQALGRIGLDMMGSDLRAAGYNPMGVYFDAVPFGNSTRIRLLMDRDNKFCDGWPSFAIPVFSSSTSFPGSSPLSSSINIWI